MKTSFARLALILLACLSLLGVSGRAMADETAKEKKVKQPAAAPVAKAAKKADNFVYLFDMSGSMSKPTASGETKLKAAKEALQKVNAGIPEELGYNAAMYTFAPGFEAKVPFGPYKKATMDKAIMALPDAPESTIRPTPLGGALSKLNDELKKAKGSTVVFLFTDGRSTDDVNPEAMAKRLYKRHMASVTVVSVADTTDGEEMNKKIAAASPRGKVIPFDAFLKNPEVCTGELCATPK